MKSFYKMHFKKDGETFELTLDQDRNFVSVKELTTMPAEESSITDKMDGFFEGAEQSCPDLKNLQQGMMKRVKKLLAKNVTIQDVRILIRLFEEMLLRRGDYGGATPSAVLQRSGLSPATHFSKKPDAPESPTQVGAVETSSSQIPDTEIVTRFLDLTVPCFFNKCEELRADLAKAISAAGGEGCSSCELGRIRTQFAQRAIQFARAFPEP